MSFVGKEQLGEETKKYYSCIDMIVRTHLLQRGHGFFVFTSVPSLFDESYTTKIPHDAHG